MKVNVNILILGKISAKMDKGVFEMLPRLLLYKSIHLTTSIMQL
jgi:hypothetical protein